VNDFINVSRPLDIPLKTFFEDMLPVPDTVSLMRSFGRIRFVFNVEYNQVQAEI